MTLGEPGRPPRARRRRPAARAAADVLAPRRARDGASRRPRAAPGARLCIDPARADLALVRHLPQRRREPAARVRAAHRSRAGLHDPRSRRRRGPARPRAPRPRLRRHEGPQPLPAEGHLPRHLLARGQQPDAVEGSAARQLPVVRRTCRRPEAPVRGLRRREAAPGGARLRRPAAVLGADDGRPDAGAARRRALRPRARRRVPGHQPAAGGDPARAEAGRPRPHGGRRRRAEHLRLSRRRGREHPRLSGPLRSAGARRRARAQLPLDPADPRRVERGHRAGRAAPREDLVDRPRLVASGRSS